MISPAPFRTSIESASPGSEMLETETLEIVIESRVEPIVDRIANGVERFASWLLSTGHSRKVSPTLKTNHRSQLAVLCLEPSKANGIQHIQERALETFCVELGIVPASNRLHAVSQRDNQAARLNEWVEHLHSKENNYPQWFIKFVLSSVTQLAQIEEDNEIYFISRDNKTIQNFPELNVHSLRNIYKTVSQPSEPVIQFSKKYIIELIKIKKIR